MYKQLLDENGNIRSTIKRLSDNAFIPNDPGNRDWIEYQAWLDLGNTPEAAE